MKYIKPFLIQEQAIWALGNIAGDSPDCRNYVLDEVSGMQMFFTLLTYMRFLWNAADYFTRVSLSGAAADYFL